MGMVAIRKTMGMTRKRHARLLDTHSTMSCTIHRVEIRDGGVASGVSIAHKIVPKSDEAPRAETAPQSWVKVVNLSEH